MTTSTDTTPLMVDATTARRPAPPAPLGMIMRLVSRMLFSHATPVLLQGNLRQLGFDDLWPLDDCCKTRTVYQEFMKHFQVQNQCHNDNGRVLRTLVRCYGLKLLWCGIGTYLMACCGVFAPLVLHHVVDAFAKPLLDKTDLMVWLSVFLASRFVNAIVAGQVAFHMQMIAMKMTASLKSLVFEKSLRLCTAGQRQRDEPTARLEISNLYTSDMANLVGAACQVNQLWVLPFQIGCVVVLLYLQLGVAAWVGLAVMGMFMLISFGIAKLQGLSFQGIMSTKDDRMRIIKEVFGAIQVVKLYAWEFQCIKKIQTTRDAEMKSISKYTYLRAISSFLLWSTPIAVSSSSFLVYCLVLGQQLTSAQAFTAIALFNTIREPLRSLPGVVQQCVQAKVSLDRITRFLHLAETPVDSICRNPSGYPDDVMIEMRNATFVAMDGTPLLKEINLRVQKGDFVVVYGRVGSGKSLLCSAILGEMIQSGGQVFVRDRVAYCSQQPWLQNMSVRDNILFGCAFDPAKYTRVVWACGLLPDLDQFPAGDSTEIGQKGVNLSGGQKARISLARACYVDADLLILDSPLAAVDALVRTEIFHRCLCGLLAKKTVVLVTHCQEIIHSHATNYKVVLENGTMASVRVDAIQPRQADQDSSGPELQPVCGKRRLDDAHVNRDAAMTVEEERGHGRVPRRVFSQYINAAGGVHVCTAVFLIQGLWQAFQIGSDFWLSHWTSSDTLGPSGKHHWSATRYFMVIYASLSGATALMVLARAVLISAAGLRASQELFQGLTQSLMYSPLRFFHANPIGRLLNRYSDDVSAIDLQVPFAYGGFLTNLFFTVCQLSTALYMLGPLAIGILPVLYLYLKVMEYWLVPSQEIARMLKVSTSPVLSHASEVEEGVSILRAFGKAFVQRTTLEFFRRIDGNNQVWSLQTTIAQWFVVRIQLVGTCVVMGVILALFTLQQSLSPGMIGIAFTYALNVDTGLAQVVRTWCFLEICMVGPERVLKYANLPAEGMEKSLVIQPSCRWPRDGSLVFENVVFNYIPGAPFVLKDVSFAIEAREKIGVIGRTGAGKSSLIMALFRINELAAGRILIDQVDIATVDLSTLRSRLSIIPQSPVLFQGTLRAYMDPLNRYADAEIWKALRKVQLTKKVSQLENKLLCEMPDKTKGDIFSVGERQMLCMARALLGKSRVVLLDEATASIDPTTEKTLQHTIHRELQDVTVITIAHRLSTVLHSSRILVLEAGRVVELDRPQVLLQNPTGTFYQMAQEGGNFAIASQASYG